MKPHTSTYFINEKCSNVFQTVKIILEKTHVNGGIETCAGNDFPSLCFKTFEKMLFAGTNMTFLYKK
jgi:hypothetical protein